MRVCRAFILAAALALVGARVGAAQTFYSTGTNVVDNIDQNWLVSIGSAATGWSDLFEPAHLWVHGSQRWISDNSVGQGNNEWFTFRQYFDLTGYNASTAALTFRWGCDDVPSGWSVIAPVLSVNGGAFGYGGTCGAYDIYDASKGPVTLSGFHAGQNYIDFRVQGNYATNGMGLVVQSFAAEPDQFSTVPEPATVVLFASGLLGLGIVTLVRRKA